VSSWDASKVKTQLEDLQPFIQCIQA